MQSLDSATKWSSRESLSSTPSLPYSESDQTEDEDDVFSSEGEGGRARQKRLSLAASPARLRPAWYSRSLPEGQLGGAAHCGQPPIPATVPPTEGDVTFAQKCSELQGYLRPLLELLNGLKMGRFEKGLNTFQQSVAVDRLQRIVGVLQKPHLGEKYLQTLERIEMMLKVWFPQVRLQLCLPPESQCTVPSFYVHWHQDQLHMPVKKRRRSCSDSDSSGSIPPVCKRAHNSPCGNGIETAEDTPLREELVISKHNANLSASFSISSLKDKQRGCLPLLLIPPPSVGSHTDTQDSFISSTTPISHSPNFTHAELHPLGICSKQDAVRDNEVKVATVKATEASEHNLMVAGLTNSSYCSLSCCSENT